MHCFVKEKKKKKMASVMTDYKNNFVVSDAELNQEFML